MGDLTLEAFLDFGKEVDAQYSKLDAKPKPRIKFYANGDIHMECYQTHRRCYPSSCNVKYRAPFVPFDDYILERARRNRAAVKNG